jgi:chromosome partitioning protein
MNNKKLPYIFVVGNEKGGAGKTTCSMHLIVGLLDKGYKVTSLDADCRQGSLTRYIENRKKYNENNPENIVKMPEHFLLKESKNENKSQKELEEKAEFERLIEEAKLESDYIVIDTPGTYSYLSSLAHSHADTVITPVNDSFVDIDVMAKIDGATLKVISPSIYSQMVWEQKLEKAKRNQGTIDWVVMRNRLSSVDAQNKKNVAKVLEELAKRVSFRQIPGFGERVIFRELFLQGLTLLDLNKNNFEKSFSLSHVAAKQELRNFLSSVL